MTDRPRILALAPNSWEGQWMNRQQILSRLATTYGIVYSTGPWRVWDRETPGFHAASLAGGFRQRQGVWVDYPPKYLLSWPTKPAWEKLMTGAVARRWRRHLDSLGTGPLIAYVFHPDYQHWAEAVAPDAIVYNPFDLFSRTPGWSPEQASRERWLLERADAVITSSEPTREALARMTTRPVHCVPNGVDAAAFSAAGSLPEPADLATIPHPRIGYVGSVNRKVDVPLIATLAEREPDWHFVFIGPVFSHDEVTEPALARCKGLANVHFLDARPKDALPAAMGALDVGLMCYRTGTWMDYAYPLKLHEYLAAGLPVVSAYLPAIHEFRELIDMATGPDEWHATLRQVLSGGARGSPAERRAEAARNTWDSRIVRIREILEQVPVRT